MDDDDISLWGIKPLDISLQFKAFQWNKAFHLSVSAIIGFPLMGGETILETDLWKTLGPELGQGGVLDECMPKPQGEFLVNGSFFAPGGKAISKSAVSVKLGRMEKSILVFGERYWKMTGPSKPSAIVRLPIKYEYAYGGEGFARNPVGKGFKPVTDEFGQNIHYLPNLEDPLHVMLSSSDQPEAATFGPIDLMWPQRQSKAGTYDEEWQREHAPGLAKDIDWSFFNVAPKDQQIEGFFQGGETYEISNMHPEHSVIKGKLPSYRARIFIQQRTPEGLAFREVNNMRFETVFFLPHINMGLLLYRGVIDIRESDATDVRTIMGAYENLHDTPRSLDHYADQLQKRTDAKTRYKYLLNTVDLIPHGARCGFARLLEGQSGDSTQSLMLQNMEEKRKKMIEASQKQINDQLEAAKGQMIMVMAAQNMDPAPYLAQLDVSQEPPKDPEVEKLMVFMETIVPGLQTGKIDITKVDLSRLPEIKDKIEAVAATKKQDVKVQLQETLAQMKAYQIPPGTDEQTIAKHQANIEKLETAIQQMDAVPEFPRPVDPSVIDEIKREIDAAVLQLEQMKSRMAESGQDVSQIPKLEIQLDEMDKMMQDFPEQFKKSYLMGAHYVEGVPPASIQQAALATEVLSRYRSGQKFINGDFAGMDLSGQDLRNIDFSGSFLEKVNFSSCDLSGANFSGAILAHANLGSAKMTGANFSGANVGSAFLMDADLTDANLNNAILSKSNLKNTRFVRAQMHGVQFMETKFENTDFSHAEMLQGIFLELNMTGCKFRDANIPKCMFINTPMPDSDFTGANLTECLWLGSNLDNGVFKRATMKNARFVNRCSLKNANFSGANLENANLMRTNLENADFSDAVLKMALFESANLHQANMERAQAFRAVFMKADLSEAKVEHVNLMEGSLMKARVTNASFRDSNLYGCELMNIIVGNTDFRGANLDMTLFRNWRP
ncbi:MAG: DUF2169 domain-containing protein [SAR324 cluster bacterium]|nr:DUF2169 domain-containing protein [SAR324 cluster bacterium]